MITGMFSNRKLNAIGTELTHYFVMKISNKRELQHIAFNHSSDVDFRDLMNLYKKCTAKPYSFLVISTTLHQIILHVLERIF